MTDTKGLEKTSRAKVGERAPRFPTPRPECGAQSPPPELRSGSTPSPFPRDDGPFCREGPAPVRNATRAGPGRRWFGSRCAGAWEPALALLGNSVSYRGADMDGRSGHSGARLACERYVCTDTATMKTTWITGRWCCRHEAVRTKAGTTRRRRAGGERGERRRVHIQRRPATPKEMAQ